MATDLATLSIRVDANQAKSELSALDKAMGAAGKAAAALGLALGAGAVFRKFVDESVQAQYALAQLEARLKSTGGIAGQSSAQLQAFAGEMQRMTTFSDEAVMSAQALLLTFTNIRGDVFPGATKAALNLATAMGGDVKGAALQLGKALQDPEQGLTALRRSGVSFSDAQTEVIKQLFATGQQAKAQQMILAELEVEFGGAAEAARNTLGGALTGLKNAWGELFEVSKADSAGIINALNSLTDFLPKVRDGFVMAFGGVRLLYVDVVNAIQQGNALIYSGTAKLLSGMANVLALAPGMGSFARTFAAAAVTLQAEANSLSDAFKAWKQEQQALITGTGPAAAGLGVVSVSAGELKKNLHEAGTAAIRLRSVTGASTVEGLGALPGVTNGLQEQNALRIFRWKQELGQKDLDEQKRREAEIAQVRENFLRQWQQTFSTGIASMLENGLSSWRDFFGSVKSMFVRLVADIASTKITASLSGVLGKMVPSGAAQNATGGAGGLFGLSAGATLGIAGVGLAIAGFVSEMHAQSNRAKAAQIEFAKATVAWRTSFDSFANQFTTSSLDKELASLRDNALSLAASAVAKASAAGYTVNTPFGSADDIRQFVERFLPSASGAAGKLKAELLDLVAAWERNAEAVRARTAAESDAEKRRAEADAAEAVRRAAEAAIEAQNRAAEAAYRAAEAERQLAISNNAAAEAAVNAASQMARAFQSLEERTLRAQGKLEEADRYAFVTRQAAEREDAERDANRAAIRAEMAGRAYGQDKFGLDPEQVRAIEIEYGAANRALADSMRYMGLLTSTQAAELNSFLNNRSGGGGGASSLPGASVGAGGGSFNTIVSRTTAVQGDRMVDLLQAGLAVWQAIEENTRPLRQFGQTVNRALGEAFASESALSGSAAVT